MKKIWHLPKNNVHLFDLICFDTTFAVDTTTWTDATLSQQQSGPAKNTLAEQFPVAFERKKTHREQDTLRYPTPDNNQRTYNAVNVQ